MCEDHQYDRIIKKKKTTAEKTDYTEKSTI